MIRTLRQSLGQRPSCVLSLSLVLALPLSAQTDVEVSGEPVPGATAAAGNNEVEGDLNCFEIWFPATDLRAIVQNYPAMGPAFAHEMRTLAKYLFREAVLRGDSSLATQRRSGLLRGIEFDWFFPEAQAGAVPLHLPDPVEVYLTADGSRSHLATIYGYDGSGYAAKKAMVEAMVGHPMETFVVFEGDVLSIPAGGEPLALRGDGNELHGPLRSAPGARFTGTRNAVHDSLSTLGAVQLGEGNRVGVLLPDVAAPEPGVPASAAIARRWAQRHGTYYPGDAVLTAEDRVPAGLVFAEGSITLAGDGLSGRWTLVSATGDVVLASDDLRLTPWIGETLAIAYAGDVAVRCDRGRVVGAIHAPDGRLELAGAKNRLVGTFVGAGVTVTGSLNVLGDGTEALKP